MKHHRPTSRRGWWALAYLLASPSHAAISFADIQLWAGSGSNQAAVVVDWSDGQSPLVWGYRWTDGASPKGSDMILAILGLDSRLSFSGTDFLSNFGFDADLNGTKDRFKGGFNGTTGEYWRYAVNNDVYNHPTDFLLNSHIVPPNTTVIQNGNPYAATSPGTWIDSSTGVLDRPLVNGSWDGFVYSVFGGAGPALPIPASPIPEPSSLLALGMVTLLMRRKRRVAVSLGAVAAFSTMAQAGPYASNADSIGTTAIPANSAAIVGWANGVANFNRGFWQIDQPSYGNATYGVAADALGASDATTDDPYNVVSLGDAGKITLTFATPMGDGLGYDLAVFENGFSNSFLELAFVEVSSNGIDFFRFPATSLTQTTTQMASFAGIDPTNINNLAGKYRAGFGTPFDLNELRYVSPKLNVNRVTHVRIVDVVGSISASYGTKDVAGNFVNDPFPTSYDSAGFDLDAVGEMNLMDLPRNLWKKRMFTPTQLANINVSGPDADPNGNGVSNLLEYALDRNPLEPSTVADPPLSVTFDQTSGVVLTFRRLHSNTDLNYTVQQSSTLNGWVDVARSTAGAATVSLGSLSGVTTQESLTVPTIVTVRIPRNQVSDRAVFRLKVTTV